MNTSRRARPLSIAAVSAAALCAAVLLSAPVSGFARGVYQAPRAFIAEVYAGSVPTPQVLWLTETLQDEARRILGHKYPAARLRYWRREARSAWILEEIGKEQPITVGIVVDQGKIELVRVLVFRESRGDEVRYPFFTRQFEGAALQPDRQLDRPIDGVTGATLSVRALTKLTRFALFLHGEVLR